MSWAARRRADAESFKTIIPASSSWEVDDRGHVRRAGTKPGRSGYCCSACREQGHTARTCGREPVRR